MKKLSPPNYTIMNPHKSTRISTNVLFFNSQVSQPRPEFRQLLLARRRSILDVRDCIGDFLALQIGLLLLLPPEEEEEERCARKLQEKAVKIYLGERNVLFDLWEIKPGNIRLHFYLRRSRQVLELWELLWGEQFGDHHIQD